MDSTERTRALAALAWTMCDYFTANPEQIKEMHDWMMTETPGASGTDENLRLSIADAGHTFHNLFHSADAEIRATEMVTQFFTDFTRGFGGIGGFHVRRVNLSDLFGGLRSTEEFQQEYRESEDDSADIQEGDADVPRQSDN